MPLKPPRSIPAVIHCLAHGWKVDTVLTSDKWSAGPRRIRGVERTSVGLSHVDRKRGVTIAWVRRFPLDIREVTSG